MKKKTRTYDSSKRKAQAAERRRHMLACATELLLDRGSPDFTLEAVADRADVSVQTILRAFGSRDSLIIEVLAVAGPSDPERLAFGNVERDGLRGAVEGLFKVYEQIGDIVIHLLAEEYRSPEFHEAVEVGRVYHHDWVRRNYGKWLDAKSGAEKAALFHALLTSTDIYIWKILRRDEALSFEASISSVHLTVKSLLGDTEND